MAKNKDIRDGLERKLLGELKHLLWSYNVSSIEVLPDDLIIEKYLQFGNESDWNNLRLAFDEKQIKAVWEDQMLLYGRELKKQEQIVAYFFNVEDPEKYISALKKQKLDRLVARGQ
ncbi:MAG: hypothetical protein RLQ12_17260 [Cyclobacteriaceae bacterium]